jgi:serine/threonine protein kinase
MAPAMAPDRWRQLRPLLDRALDLDEPARQVFLAEISLQSADLREDLERLINRHEVSGGFSRPAAAAAGPALGVTEPIRATPIAGRRIGPFQLIRLLGAGGMGAVYEAQRVDGGFRQTVAIKLVSGIHPGLTARFERERQILAELRHPHIAQLLDGGESDDGMPYFALEYVDGRPITEYADAIDADIDTRLRLLIEVAEALAYAHRRDVIHRDIKPTNILVSADGHVKLLDFGIAKLLKGDSGPTLTQQRMGPMTPDYAAPEQFRGAHLSAATDVYQFGVLMFRMLSGRMPYHANADDSLAWARAVSEQEPLSLSGALREARRLAGAGTPSTEITLKRFALRRAADLDAIVRRCLAKEPGARYPGMDALIADLQRYLTPGQAPRQRSPWLLASALLLPLLLVGAWLLRDRPATTSVAVRAVGDDWAADPALIAYGLRPENLHVQQPGTTQLIRQALLTEARGDAPAALALMASVHRSDATTPVPALFSAYWLSGLGTEAELSYWRAEAETRVRAVNDPFIDLLNEFMSSDAGDGTESSLRYSAAILEMRPDAWFLHLARAHALNKRDLREAALRELQAIDVPRLGHRKLVDAIADRGSLGDLPGAWRQFERLELIAEDPDRAALRARLTYSSGDLVGARDAFLQAVELARAAPRFDVEARGLLWAGVFSAALGDYPQAQDQLQQAQARLAKRAQFHYAADAALALAQLAALRGNSADIRPRLDEARAFLGNTRYSEEDIMADLIEARLTGILPAAKDSSELEPAAMALRQARAAMLDKDPAAAIAALERARSQGIGVSPMAEEAEFLARELGVASFQLRAIDPPFGPYSRYLARCALGMGPSIAPPRTGTEPVP